jgi:hypothetical protein
VAEGSEVYKKNVTEEKENKKNENKNKRKNENRIVKE